MFIETSRIIGIAGSNLPEFIVNTINWFIGFAAVLSVVMIIVSGFQFVTSFGDPKKISKATSSLVFCNSRCGTSICSPTYYTIYIR